MDVGYGLSGDAPVDVIRAVARASEDLGYSSFWLNYPRSRPDADGLAALPLADASTDRVPLGMGVVPLTSRPADEIVAWFDENPYPLERFWLGIGSGNTGPGALTRVSEGIAYLRERLPCQLVVAAYGEKMCRLGGEIADGVLLNFVTPGAADRCSGWVRAGAAAAGRPAPRIQAYVRFAVGDDAAGRVEKDGASHVARHADHFAGVDSSVTDAAVVVAAGQDPSGRLAAWAPYVDEVILKPLPAEKSVRGHLQLVSAGAPPGQVFL